MNVEEMLAQYATELGADLGRVREWHQKSRGNCKRCGASMRHGIAIEQTYTAGEPDFPSDRGDPNAIVTLSPGGPGKLIECLKCPQCGWSVTKETKE
ncbi:MAG: hypothetical protein Q4A28_06395 [Brachymonas sp.]|nr:hypothetical protein [Brachymonas sp.]